MSLRAKLEAVIYAAEEPVTLPQLAQLLAGDILAEEAEAAAAAGAPGAEEAVEDARAEPGEDLDPETSGQSAAFAQQGSLGSLGEAAGGAESRREEDGPGNAPEGADPESTDSHSSDADSRARRQQERRLRERVRAALDELVAEYAAGNRGIEIREVAGGFRFSTKPEYHDAVRGFIRSQKPVMKLSLQALETLAVIAYKQPITAPEIAEIRGVDAGGVLGSLLGRKLVTTAGRKQVIGRPILYKTTREFLLRFGLSDLSELPSIEEFEKMAGELEDSDPLAPAPRQEDLDLGEPQAAPPAVLAAIDGSEPGAAEQSEPQSESQTGSQTGSRTGSRTESGAPAAAEAAE